MDVLALTISLTLDKLFNLSEPVFLSVSTVTGTKYVLNKYLWVSEKNSEVLSALPLYGFPNY